MRLIIINTNIVVPAKAGTHADTALGVERVVMCRRRVDPRLRGGDNLVMREVGA